MQKLIVILFLLINAVGYSQQKSSKKFKTAITTLEIDTKGLDEITVENSEDDFISIFLDEENLHAHHIFTEEENGFLKIAFEPVIRPQKKVFRKFITERLNRASVKIKIPKNKNLTFLGDEIDIISKSYIGNLTIFIDKGTLKLYTLKGNLELALFSGNVFANYLEGEIDVKSSKGKIKIDDKIVSTSFKRVSKKSERKLVIKSILANITLVTKKTQ